MNGDAHVNLPEIRVKHLTRTASDHAPLLVQMTDQPHFKGRFLFQKMWIDHPDFMPLISNVWQSEVRGSPSYIVSEKLKRLRYILKKWNWEVFGNVQENIKSITLHIDELEAQLMSHWNDDQCEQVNSLKQNLEQALKWESDLLIQKAKADWLKDGDKNTKFDHADRRKRNLIKLQDDDGSWINEAKTIADKAVQHFSQLFAATPYHIDEALFQGYQSRLDAEDNLCFTRLPESYEILEAIKSLSPESSPGIDGFTGYFFVACWEILKDDILNMVTGFFLGDHLYKGITSTCLILIPKVENPKHLGEYRPISLG